MSRLETFRDRKQSGPWSIELTKMITEDLRTSSSYLRSQWIQKFQWKVLFWCNLHLLFRKFKNWSKKFPKPPFTTSLLDSVYGSTMTLHFLSSGPRKPGVVRQKDVLFSFRVKVLVRIRDDDHILRVLRREIVFYDYGLTGRFRLPMQKSNVRIVLLGSRPIRL